MFAQLAGPLAAAKIRRENHGRSTGDRTRCRGQTGRGLDFARERAPLKLEQFLPYQLNVVASLVSQALSRVYARRYRIGVPEWRVLVTLGQYGVMTGKAIGAHTHMHKTKVSRAVALLEKRKLLVRRSNRADMREVFSLAHRRPAARCTRKWRRTRSTSPAGSPRFCRRPTAKRSIAR